VNRIRRTPRVRFDTRVRRRWFRRRYPK